MQGIKHKHVVRVLGINLQHDPPYFLMPLAAHSIDAEIDHLKNNEGEAIEAFHQMCLGVSAIHASGAVHRDIKPLNALRFEGGVIAVTDLGLAKIEPRDTTVLTQTSAFIGTRPYSAPEQLLEGGSRDADERTDIFQLGATLYHILTGRSPALIDVSTLPRGLGYIILKATKAVPDERYQTIGKFMDAIESYRKSKDPTHNPQQTFENLVGQAKELLKQRQYERGNIESMLGILSNGASLSDETTLVLFRMIPLALLPHMANEFPDELARCLLRYIESLKKLVRSKSFEYAELVADRMKVIFKATDNVELRRLSLLATLVAAVDLHRFAAMDIFNEMIVNLTADDAVPVAESLREYADRYKVVAGAVSRDKLNAAIRDVRDNVLDDKPSSQREQLEDS
jgi:serine/threonine protein kinase